MPATLPTPDQRFKAKLKAFLQQFGYRDGIGMLQWDLIGREIAGKFADINGRKAFEFTINGEGLAYKPLTGIRKDAYTHGLTLVATGAVSSSSNAYLRGRMDAQQMGKKNCTSASAYSCGNSCINKNKQCRIRDVKVRQASLALVKEAGLIKGSQQSTAISAKALQQRVEAEEDKIKNLPYERGIIVDSKTGKVLVNKGGAETSVGFTPQEVALMKGNVLTHNHPNIWKASLPNPLAKGVSFSDPDIRTGCIAEVSEVRAVSSGYRHSMKPPPEGFNPRFYQSKVAPAYQRNSSQVYNQLSREILAGRMAPEAAEVEYHHQVWKRTAKETGMVYSRTPIRNARRQAA